MSPWARFLGSRPLAVLIGCLVIGALAAVWGSGVFGQLSNGGFEDPTSESYKVNSLVKEHFGQVDPDLVVIYHTDSGTINDPATIAKVTDKLKSLPSSAVAQTIPWFADESGRLVGDDGRAGMVLVNLSGDQSSKLDSYNEIKDDLAIDGLEVLNNGAYPMFNEINRLAYDSIVTAETIALPIVFLLSVLVFGSVVAAIMPTLVGGAAIIGGFALLRTVGLFEDVNSFAVQVVTLLGMGLAIDYALFVVTRFREELAKQAGHGRVQSAAAIKVTMATAGRTVLFSGLTVAISIATLLLFPIPYLASLGWGGLAAVLVAMAASLTLLPAVLVLLGPNINKAGIPVINRMQARAEERGGWAKLAQAVMARPLAFIVPIVVALVVLATPLLHVSWGQIDAAMLPKSSPVSQSLQKQTDWFGDTGGSAEVLVTGSGATDQAGIAEYTKRLSAVEGVADVQVARQSASGAAPATLIRVTWPGLSQSEHSQDLAQSLRDVPGPGGAEVLIGGPSASTVDVLKTIGDILPLMLTVIVVAMFVLLFLAFGSVVLPLKALLMNVLSLGAAFGIVTWIFADGHLEGLLRFDSPGYLDPTIPLLMVAVLFGLSMDYEVFLLSRVKEEYDLTSDNTAAVSHGLQKTGRLITSAAALLCVVIAGFAASELFFMKMVGYGMLVAIILDATVVRALLVPATMRLLGRWNWWSPKFLRGITDRISFTH
ncbi:MMPL family transporter [Propionibacteriaceae bacterium G1746]|uniref:MMPL family transporter n=1 Tax=Aestuariimicrobium sp. G57 TaxID=3418485 RepID=UPI003C14B366